MATVDPTSANLLHVPAYGLLAWLWLWSLTRYGISKTVALIAAMTICGMYGALLELIQIPVPGRFASVLDASLNMAGILIMSGSHLALNHSKFGPLMKSRLIQ